MIKMATRALLRWPRRAAPPPPVALLPADDRKKLLSSVLGCRRSRRAHAAEVTAICNTSPVEGVLAAILTLSRND